MKAKSIILFIALLFGCSKAEQAPSTVCTICKDQATQKTLPEYCGTPENVTYYEDSVITRMALITHHDWRCTRQ